MNLLKFLEQVSKAELAGFVHDMARILPEAERTDFLCRLRNIRKKDALKAVKPDVEKGIIEKFNRIKTDLERIEKEELCLAGSTRSMMNGIAAKNGFGNVLSAGRNR